MIKNISKYKFWFVTGNQDLYGERALAQVEKNSVEIVEYLNKSGKLPSEILFKGIGADSRSISLGHLLWEKGGLLPLGQPHLRRMKITQKVSLQAITALQWRLYGQEKQRALQC